MPHLDKSIISPTAGFSKQQLQDIEEMRKGLTSGAPADMSKQEIQDNRQAVNDALDRLMGAATAAAGVGLNIDIVKEHVSKMKTYTYLGAIHADHKVSQIRVDKDTTLDTISDILEMWENHQYESKTCILVIYIAQGDKLDAELTFATFNENATPEEFARCLKDVYGETGVQVIDFPTYGIAYSTEGKIGVDADLIRRAIIDVYKRSKPVKTEIDVPSFMTRR